MDVIFENKSGKAFCVEVGYFDTVLEIKEKVQKYHGIPVTSQTLVFNGQVLEDERDVEYCEILHNSLIQLLVASDSDDDNYKQQLQVNEQQKKQTSSPSKETQLNVNAPSSITSVPIEMDVNDSVLPLKEKVHDQMEVETVSVNRLVIQSDGRLLTDDKVVNLNIMPSPPTSYGKGATGATTGSKKLKLTENNAVDVNIMSLPTSSGKGAAEATTGSNTLKRTWNDVKIMPRPTSSGKGAAGATTGSNTLKTTWNDINIIPPPTSSVKGAAGATTGSNMLKLKWKDTFDVDIMLPPTSSGKGTARAKTTTSSGKLKLLVSYGTKKVEVEMNATDNVGDLRKQLQNLQKKFLFPLPEEGYFFIHKQNVMDDDRTFRWHQVAQGDTIEIFNGYVTRG